jgi:hypothetical protein
MKDATRYCGELQLFIFIDPNSVTYRVSIHLAWKHVVTLEGIRRSPHDERRIACDSDHAFDSVARAAISFAEADHYDVYSYAETDDPNGEIVIRDRR